MSNESVTLASGAQLQITSAPFKDAHALHKALLAAAKGIPLAADPFKQDVSVLKDIVINAATSDDVEACLFRCFERVTYDGLKLKVDLFDDPKIGDKVRTDFYLIAWEVARHNCAPFFGQAFSLLKSRLGTQASVPASQ